MRNRFAKTVALSLVFLAGAASCPAQSMGTGSYSKDIQPLFNARCVSCHAGNHAPSHLQLDSWEHLIAGARQGEAVIPYDPANSLLVELVTRANGPAHPAELKGDTLTTPEIDRVKTWIADGAKSDDGKVPFEDSKEFIYVCDEGASMVSVIDVKAGVVARDVDLHKAGFSDNAKPHHAAVEPDGSYWYVSLIADDKVLKFDRDDNLIGVADFERPGLLALDPNSNKVYVGHSMKAINPPQTIGVIDRSTMDIEDVNVFIPRPHAMALSKDAKYVYTASLAANQVVTVQTQTLQADLLNIPGPVHTLVQFAVSPDGGMMVAGGQLSGKLLFFALDDPGKPELVDSLHVNAEPWHPVYSRDGSLIYLPNKGANSVTVVNAAEHSLNAVIQGTGLAQPHGSALSLDGRRLFISNNNADGSYKPRYDLGNNAKIGTVTMIDTESKRILKVIEVEENASGIGSR